MPQRIDDERNNGKQLKERLESKGSIYGEFIQKSKQSFNGLFEKSFISSLTDTPAIVDI